MFAMHKTRNRTLTNPPKFAPMFYFSNNRLILSFLSIWSFNMYLNSRAFLWLPDYLVDKGIPLIIFVKIGKYLPYLFRACTYFDFSTNFLQTAYDRLNNRNGFYINRYKKGLSVHFDKINRSSIDAFVRSLLNEVMYVID